jgi:type VI secretion system protein ImpJ
MSLSSKPLWLEGMFVRPQHLQQQNRYLETLIERRTAGLRVASWGMLSLTVDRDLLRLGRFGVTSCEAVMPDGTVIYIPQDIEAPAAREITPDTRDRIIKLAVPIRRGDGLEIQTGDGGGRTARFQPSEIDVVDSTSVERKAIALRVGHLRARLLLDGESEEDMLTLPLARVENVDATGAVALSANFLPPALDCSAVARFGEIMREVEGLLHSLGDTVAGRVDPSRVVNQMAGVVDYLLLATINRFEPIFTDFGRTKGLHPRELHTLMLSLAGELATYGATQRRPVAFPPYRHGDLEGSFAPLVAAIRSGLAIVMDERTVSIALEPRDYGIWLGPIADRTILRGARFVLAVKSSVPPEMVRARFPMQVKLGPVEVIRDLVNLQIPGIVLEPLPVAPRELPYYPGFTYFALGQSSELWGRLNNSSAFALHVGAEFSDLSMELWAIRERA